MAEIHDEPPKSPIGQVFLRLFSPKSEHIINCALGLRYPIDIESLKTTFTSSIMLKHPRFCSLIVRANTNSITHWKRTRVNIDDHIIIHQTTMNTGLKVEDDDEKEAAINTFLAEISVSTPLSENKPLWELHVLMDLKCVVLRVHHALGDGVSLMSMLCSCFGQKREIKSGVNGDYSLKDHTYAKREWGKKGVWELVNSVWLTFVYMMGILGRVLWVKDKVSVVSGGDGVELWPRKLVTAKFLLEDFKSIKMVIPKATINDVLLGVISSGLSKYLHIKSSKAQQTLQLTAITVVNLRKGPCLQEMSELMMSSSISDLSGWGNKAGILLLPINCCNGLHPLEHVRVMKATMDQKKHSFEAHLVYRGMQFLVSYLSPKVGCWCFHKVLCSASLTISNIVGPSEEMVIADNPVTYIKVNVSSLPTAITMNMVSYAGMVNLQVLVAKDIITDPDALVKCLQDSFLEMKSSIKVNVNEQV